MRISRGQGIMGSAHIKSGNIRTRNRDGWKTVALNYNLQDVSYVALCSSFGRANFSQLGHVKNRTMGRLLLRGQDPSHHLGSSRTSDSQ